MNCSRCVDGGLHGFGGLQDFGYDQFVVVEQAADFGHAVHQRAVDDIEGLRAFLELQVQVRDQAVLGAFDDVARQAHVEGKFGDDDARFLAGAAEVFGDGGDVELIDGDFLFAGLLAPVFGSGNVWAAAC